MTAPMSVNEAYISRLRPRDKSTGEIEKDTVLDLLEHALAGARKNVEAIDAVVAALDGDATQTAAARKLTARKVALDGGAKAAARIDGARAQAVAAIDELAREIHAPELPEGSEAIATVIVSRLAALPDIRRQQIMAAAIKSNDAATVAAVLSSPPWLSGHTDAELNARRAEWQRTHHAAEYAQLERWRTALTATERAGQALVGFVSNIVEHRVAAEAAAQSDRTAAALAAANSEAAQ